MSDAHRIRATERQKDARKRVAEAVTQAEAEAAAQADAAEKAEKDAKRPSQIIKKALTKNK
jgi:SOS response regulatory protein OraA/RecX